jgi:hypothetical protein
MEQYPVSDQAQTSWHSTDADFHCSAGLMVSRSFPFNIKLNQFYSYAQ